MFARCTIHGFTGNAVGILQIGFLFRIDIDIVWKGHRFSWTNRENCWTLCWLFTNLHGQIWRNVVLISRSPTYPRATLGEWADLSYISLQNLASRLHEIQTVHYLFLWQYSLWTPPLRRWQLLLGFQYWHLIPEAYSNTIQSRIIIIDFCPRGALSY